MLFLVFCFGVFVRFQGKSAKKGDFPTPNQMAERMAVVSKYASDIPDEVRDQLWQTALEMEESEAALELLNNQSLSNQALEGLSPTYRLMADHRATPSDSSKSELESLAAKGLQRFTLTLSFLGGLVCFALLSLFLPKKEVDEEPGVPSRLDWLGILGLFFCWDAMGLFGSVLLAELLRPFLQAFVLIVVIQCALYGFFLALYHFAPKSEGFRPFTRPNWSWIGKGYALALFTVFTLNMVISKVTGELPTSENPVLQIFQDASAWQFLLLGLLVVGIGPLFEEIVFRMWLYGGLRDKWGDLPAALLSSAIFALIHGDGPGLPALFCLGLIFCLVYRKSGSLWGCILVHSMWNATTFSFLLSILP